MLWRERDFHGSCQITYLVHDLEGKVVLCLNVPRGTSFLGTLLRYASVPMGIPKSTYSLLLPKSEPGALHVFHTRHPVSPSAETKACWGKYWYLENAWNHPDRTRLNSLRIASTRVFVGWDAPGILTQVSVGECIDTKALIGLF